MSEPIAQPITSAPVAKLDASIPTEYQRHDATAVSSVEYQQLAARAQAERRAAAQFADPRSITGRAYAQGARPRRTLASAPKRVPSTHPVAEYQPVPAIRVDEPMTVRLNLTVGADGRVEEIAMHGTAGRNTREILSAVRRWRYKPATVNGQPVSAPVTVDISFNSDE
jgi:TonB family protein